MKIPIRRILAESHISVVAIAMLLVVSLDSAVRFLGQVWLPLTDYVATAIATFSFPYAPYSFSDQVFLSVTLYYLYEAVAALAAAWILSRWSFGRGPVRALAGYVEITSAQEP